MRGEHFLLLAEREQLLTPAVLRQLKQILREQKRPARGEAIARLLVERGFLTVAQARRLVEAGSGGVSPLVASPNPLEAPLTPSCSAQRPLHDSAELLLEPISRLPDPHRLTDQKPVQSDKPAGKVTPPQVPPSTGSPPLESATTGVTSPPESPVGFPTSPARTPVVCPPETFAAMDEASLSELSDSFSQWMDLSAEATAAESPSPLFAPARAKIPPALLFIGLATTGVLLVLFGLVILTKLRAG